MTGQNSSGLYVTVLVALVAITVLVLNSGVLQQLGSVIVPVNTGVKGGEGASCNVDSNCRTGYVCGYNGCVAEKSLEKGGRCKATIECARETYCKDEYCVAQLSKGWACSLDEQCMTGHCILETNKCA